MDQGLEGGSVQARNPKPWPLWLGQAAGDRGGGMVGRSTCGVRRVRGLTEVLLRVCVKGGAW